MFAVWTVTFAIAFRVMGATGALEEGSYNMPALWVIVRPALGLIAAVAGGFVCAAITKDSKAPLVLAGLVLAFGLLVALSVVTASNDGQPVTREADVSTLDAMQGGKQPAWVAIVNPLLGVIGVLLGSRLKTGQRRTDLTA